MLDIKFLGTCACDFSERLKTDLKDKLDKDVRRSSSMLIDGEILVDCGPHTLDSLRIMSISLDKICSVVITHLHDDHFNMDNIMAIAKSKSAPLKLYVREDADIDTSCGIEIIKMKSRQKNGETMRNLLVKKIEHFFSYKFCYYLSFLLVGHHIVGIIHWTGCKIFFYD